MYRLVEALIWAGLGYQRNLIQDNNKWAFECGNMLQNEFIVQTGSNHLLLCNTMHMLCYGLTLLHFWEIIIIDLFHKSIVRTLVAINLHNISLCTGGLCFYKNNDWNILICILFISIQVGSNWWSFWLWAQPIRDNVTMYRCLSFASLYPYWSLLTHIAVPLLFFSCGFPVLLQCCP